MLSSVVVESPSVDLTKLMQQMPSLDFLHEVSRDKLDNIFKNDFPKSEEYKDLVLFLHDNMVEFNCWHQAGLLSAS
jgi:hypothetical protein